MWRINAAPCFKRSTHSSWCLKEASQAYFYVWMPCQCSNRTMQVAQHQATLPASSRAKKMCAYFRSKCLGSSEAENLTRKSRYKAHGAVRAAGRGLLCGMNVLAALNPFGKMARPKILILTGPTGAGKTDTSIILAKRLKGEIISADSVQVYRGLDIGSDKLPQSEWQGGTSPSLHRQHVMLWHVPDFCML
jgi:hypothetical protein